MAIDSTAAAKAVMGGLRNAQRTYQTWSGLLAPPENLTTVSVARAILHVDGAARLTLQSNIAEVLSEAGRRPGRPPEVLRSRGRFDIVVRSGSNVPRGVIEIKSIWIRNVVRDVERVCGAIESTDRIRWGLVACIYADDDAGRSGAGRATERAANAFHGAEEVVDRSRYSLNLKQHQHRARHRQVDNGAWMAQVLQIYR